MAKRGRPRTKQKGYFYDDEENAIVAYITSEDETEKNKIYNEVLHPALTKMVESIINRYKLYVPDEEFQETFDDTISFLMTKITKFKPESGYKAYSYCGTICKNYLIYKIQKYGKKVVRDLKYEDMQAELEDNLNYSYNIGFDNDNQIDYVEMLSGVTTQIREILEEEDLKDSEIKVGFALLEILDNWEDLFIRMGSNKFNKSSILMFIKETTMLSQNEIRNGMKKYKCLYQNIKKNVVDDIYSK